MATTAFKRLEAEGVPFYSCMPFQMLPKLRQGFSTRHGGAPPDGSLNLGNMEWDTPERVEENRLRFLSALRMGDIPLATLSQVHSNRVHIITGAEHQWNCPPEGDALISEESGLALAVRVADCFPLLLADPDKGAIGVVHAGWRGILSHILVHTVGKMKEAFGSDPHRIMAALGPGIRSCCMEVGPEVVSLFEQEFPRTRLFQPLPGTGGKGHLDLIAALDADRRAAGLDPERFHDLGMCTRCTPGEFFSHRREGSASGRMMAAIGIQ